MRTKIASPLAETAAGAIAGEVLRACVHCGMCNATCPTYQLTGDELDGPRGRIYLIKQALEGEPVGRLSQVHLDRCLSCRACETTCPSGVQYHRLLDVGREAIAEKVRRPLRERLWRAALRWLCVEPWRLASLIAIGRPFRSLMPAGLRGKLPARVSARPSTAGDHPRRMSLLTGCVQSATAPHFNAATRRVFDGVGIALGETPGVRCCGALSAHLDAPEEARLIARRNIDIWTAELDTGAQAIVVNASGCAAFIRDYPDLLADDAVYSVKARRIAGHVRDPAEVLTDHPPTAVRAPARRRIAVHQPCTLRNGPGLGDAPARILAGLGYEPQPVADAHLCCGSAGAYSLLQPEMAGRLREAKISALTEGAPEAIYTANIGCWMHLAETAPVPVRHWIEAVDDVVSDPGTP
ncbi:MAG: glycolate oxidase iron-sulfur subunit [Caulobacteraceae bacterium]|nr:glycolate oxidase iron-sulfur subunit [Caulobacteraceae bacterium]